MNSNRFSGDGLIEIKNRMNSFCDLFNRNEFPFTAQMLEFGVFKINSREECLARINELSELTGTKFKIIKEVTSDGETQTIEVDL